MSSVLQSAMQTEIDVLRGRLEALLQAQAKLFGGAPPPAQKERGRGPEATPPKRVRLAAEDVETALAQVVALLEDKRDGLRTEAIKATLGIEKPMLVKAIKLGLESDQIAKTGEKRATTYFAPIAPSKAQSQGRVVRRKK